MLNFCEPTFEDKSWIDSVLDKSSSIGCENTFGSIFLWRKFFGTKILNYNGILLRAYLDKDGYIEYSFPVFGNNLEKDFIKEVLNSLLEDARTRKNPLVFTGLEIKDTKTLEKIFPGKFKFVELKDREDYVYLSKDLINLKGKKYHGKRNHISKFKKLYKSDYEDLNSNNIKEVLSFIDLWFKSREDTNVKSLECEHKAIRELLESYHKFNFKAGIIKVDGKIIAFTAGEEINKDTFVIHFEKALSNYEGSYAIINNEFAKNNLFKYTYINREEDMGIPGLRKAKLSYHPVFLLKRYKAIYLE